MQDGIAATAVLVGLGVAIEPDKVLLDAVGLILDTVAAGAAWAAAVDCRPDAR